VIEQQFTGKERDSETGLDYFGARYFSGAQGRFTSPDKIVHPAQSSVPEVVFIADPQRWNMYAYVRNNPLVFVDLDGLELVIAASLQKRYDQLAAKSEAFRSELAAEKADPNMRVVVVERGLRQNDEKSSGDATVMVTDVGYMHATVYVDSARTGDSTVAHEHGHVKDARENTKQFLKDAGRTKKNKGGPAAQRHNDRPEEERADKFMKRVEQEAREAEKQEKQKKKEEKERKKEAAQ